MKKIFFLLICSVFLLCSCSKNESITYSQQPFEAAVSAQSDGASFDANIKYTSPQEISLTINSPQNIAKLTITKRNGSFFSSFCGENFDYFPSASLTGKNNLIENLFFALESIGSMPFEISQEQSMFDADGPFGSCSVQIDPQKQRLVGIKSGKCEYSFEYNEKAA